ncbi:U32 family peptidase [bacterium]|nr:U32 family peptidase [bacterium]
MKRELSKTIEILSPGKNLFYAKEAIRCGADSIYIGAPKFSLRHEQANSMEDIKFLVDFAHKYWARVYIPLNCLLYTKEDINLAQQMIKEFYEMGIDGLIIQDIGILELDLPPIPIIISTNAMCFTKENAEFFEKCGVSRIVLPRELTFEEIKDITENTNVEIETFCYGFLCVGYSGNCYLSYIENLKNTQSSDKAHYLASNHGVCPERCMGNWTLKDDDGNVIRENDRLFNLRFLNLENDIEKLFDIGVNSFKIAGREKDLKHVKNSTAIFSQKADMIAQKKGIKRLSSGKVILGFKPDLYKNFNKGYTDFFMNGRKKEMYSKYDLVGENVGAVKKFHNNSFELSTDIELNIGDKLRYQKNDELVKTIEIIDKKDGRYFIKSINDNIDNLSLFRYINTAGFKEVEESVNYRVISVKVDICEENNQYNVTAIDEDNNRISFEYKKGSNKIEDITKSLYALDLDCEFIIDKVNTKSDCYIDNIDEFKNNLFDLMRIERAKNRPVEKGNVIKNNVPYYKKELTYLANVTNDCTKAFYKRHGVEKIESGLETGIPLEGKRVFSSRYCLRNELGLCSKQNQENIPKMPWHLEQLENGNKFTVKFDCAKCSMYLYLDNEEDNK